jgi:hypothetical protein
VLALLRRVIMSHFNPLKRSGTYMQQLLRESYIYISRPRWPRGLRRRSAAAWLLGSRVRIPLRALMFVSCVSVLSCVGRGHCDGLVTRPEESYRMCQLYVIKKTWMVEEKPQQWGKVLRKYIYMKVLVDHYLHYTKSYYYTFCSLAKESNGFNF